MTFIMRRVAPFMRLVGKNVSKGSELSSNRSSVYLKSRFPQGMKSKETKASKEVVRDRAGIAHTFIVKTRSNQYKKAKEKIKRSKIYIYIYIYIYCKHFIS